MLQQLCSRSGDVQEHTALQDLRNLKQEETAGKNHPAPPSTQNDHSKPKPQRHLLAHVPKFCPTNPIGVVPGGNGAFSSQESRAP